MTFIDVQVAASQLPDLLDRVEQGELVSITRTGGCAVDLLDVTLAHVVCAAELPSHHRDPFDRLLVAQARLERFTLVTGDRAIRRYDVPILPARA